MKRRSLFQTALCAIAFSAMDCMGLKAINLPTPPPKSWIIVFKNGLQCAVVADQVRQELQMGVGSNGRHQEISSLVFRDEKGGFVGQFWNTNVSALINPAGHRFGFDLS